MPTYPYLTQVVHDAARSRPDQPCLIYGVRRTSNAQLPVHAVVVLKPDAPPASGQDLIGPCQFRIAGYKCPRSIDFRDTLPTSAASKILKSRLRAEYAKQEAQH